MEYKRFDNDIVLRMNRGEEIITVLKEISTLENIKLATVQGIGACDHVKWACTV